MSFFLPKSKIYNNNNNNNDFDLYSAFQDTQGRFTRGKVRGVGTGRGLGRVGKREKVCFKVLLELCQGSCGTDRRGEGIPKSRGHCTESPVAKGLESGTGDGK